MRHNSRVLRCFYFLIPVFILTAYILAVVGVTETTIIEGFRFLIFQLAGIMVPGCAIAVLFKKFDYDLVSFSVFGYALGYSLNIVTYFIFMPVGLKSAIPIAVLAEFVLGLLSLVYFRGRIRNISVDKETVIICGISFMLMAVFRFFFSVGANVLPIDGVTVGEAIHKDTLYHTGDTISAARSFPLMDFRWYSEQFFYHVFSNIHMAVNYLSTGISAYILDGYFRGIESAFLLSYGLYSLLTNLGISGALKKWGMLTAFFTTGAETIVCSSYIGHLYYESIGFDVGLAFSILAVSAFTVQIKKEETDVGAIILAMIFFAVAVGAKGPCALLAMAGMGCVCIYWIFHKRAMRGFACGICLVVIFGLLFFTVLSSGLEALHGGTGGNGLEFPVPFKAMFGYPVGEIYNTIKWSGYPRIIAGMAMVLSWAILVQPAVVIPAVITFINRIFVVRELKAENVMLLGGWLSGVFMFLTSWHHAASEMYFIMASFFYGSAYSAYNFEAILPSKIRLKKYLFAFLTVSGLCFCAYSVAGYGGKGIKNLFMNVAELPGVEVSNSLREEEYDAYIWIRDNTPEDSIILSNVFLIEEKEARSNFLTSVLCERFAWLDGWIFVYYHDAEVGWKREVLDDLFAGRDVENAVKSEPIDYVIWVKAISPDFVPPQYLKVVYDNTGVGVYQVIR